MPPRYAYWTILIDDKPTAFRAREREELQPTFVQLQRKNSNVTMRWFARGKLWASREAEREDFQTQKHAADAPREPRGERPEGAERRSSDWRPGGSHKDPRDRFKKKNRPERAWSEKDPATQRDRDKPGYAAKKPWEKPHGDRPPVHRSSSDRPRSEGGWRDKPAGPPRGDRPPVHRSSSDRPRSEGGWRDKPAPPNDRPWQTKPTGPRAQRKPWVGKPGPPGEGAGFKPRERKPWTDKPSGAPPPAHRNEFDSRKRESGRGDRPWQDRKSGVAQGFPGPPKRDVREGGRPPDGDRKPWQNKPGGPPRGDRPWSNKPAGEGKRPWTPRPPDRSGPPRERKPWTDKASGGPPRGDRPWQNKPAGGPPRGDRPWSPKPGGAWKDKPREPRRSSSDKPSSEGGSKRRDDDPDRD